MKINKWNKYYRLLIVLVGWFGVIGTIAYKVLRCSPGQSVALEVLDSLSHYTIQTNIIVMLWFTCALFRAVKKGENSLSNTRQKTGIMLYISLTFIIYAILLQGLWEPKGMDAVLAYITHYVTPFAMIVDWVYCEFTAVPDKLQKKHALKWLIYPACYAAYAMVYGYLSGRYMYPFLNAPEIGYPMVFLSIVVISAFLISLGLIAIGLSKKIQNRRHYTKELRHIDPDLTGKTSKIP